MGLTSGKTGVARGGCGVNARRVQYPAFPQCTGTARGECGVNTPGASLPSPEAGYKKQHPISLQSLALQGFSLRHLLLLLLSSLGKPPLFFMDVLCVCVFVCVFLCMFV